MVESEEHAKAIVQACRHPPLGRRGAAFGLAQRDYLGGDVAEKIRNCNERTLVIAQIETERGLDQVERIAAVEGIDVLWVGHFDLSSFMGIPGQFDHPRCDAAMREVAQVARKHGKATAFLATDAAWIARAREMGFTMIAGGTDTGLLELALKNMVGQIQVGAMSSVK